MNRTLAALCFTAPAGTLLIGGCNLNDLAKNSCFTNADCDPGRVCTASKVCVDEPADAGPPDTGYPEPDSTSPTPEPDSSSPNPDSSLEPDVIADAAYFDTTAPVPPPATCALPDGNIRALPTVDDAYQAIVGQWFYCSGAPSDTLGQPIEFTSDKHWYILVWDATGHLVPASGFAGLQQSGTFVITAPESDAGFDAGSGGNNTFNIELDPLAGGSLSSNLSFSDVPAEASSMPTSKMLLGGSTYVSVP